jgi:putative exporter of polyketide antibiotics
VPPNRTPRLRWRHLLAALAAFLLATLGRLVDALDAFGRLSPFEWLLGAHPVSSASWGGLLVALGLSVVFLGSGVVAFDRRDLR